MTPANGDGQHNRIFREQLIIHRLRLHPSSLSSREPATGQDFRFP